MNTTISHPDKQQLIEMSLSSYYVWIILGATAFTAAGWVWCMAINRRQGVGSFNMGNLLYLTSYLLLIGRNVYLCLQGPNMRDALAIRLTLTITLLQLGAVAWFVMTYYWNRQQKNEWGIGAFDAQMDKTGDNDKK
jgi:hypothetical protein